MKYIYELTLNHREHIIDRVLELYEDEAYFRANCESEDIRHNNVHLLHGIILDVLKDQCAQTFPTQDALNLEKVIKSINSDILRSLLLCGVSIKSILLLLKHFRYCINKLIVEISETKEELFAYTEANLKLFDLLELALHEHWETVDKGDALLKSTLDFTPFGVFIEEAGSITYVNSTGEKLCGYSGEELRQKSVFDIIHPDYIEALSSGDVLKNLEGKYECVLIDKNGENVWVELSIGEIQKNGRNCILGTAINITDRKKLEELQRQTEESIKLLNEALECDKLKTEFFSNLSHELRTPLNVLLGTLQLVELYSSKSQDPLAEKTKKYYKIMRQNCYRLLRQVNNLIDLNKLDAGFIHLNMENCDIANVVSDIASSVTDYIENKGINFHYSAEIGSQVITCDPDKIERIILNLLSNAIKFTEPGGFIEVRLWKTDKSIFISVKDSGIGIPKEKQNMVFRRFIQVDKSLSRTHQGSGIGLSLVKSLVEMHEGKITLYSEPGTGCEFIVELPIKHMAIMEKEVPEYKYNSNNKIEVINIEFADIYS